MPKSSQIHQNRPLEKISVSYRNGDLVADELSPGVPVRHDSDTFYVYERDNLRLNETLRATGGEANEADWALSTATYRLERHDLNHLVPDDDRENADPAIRLDIDTTEFLTDQIMLRKEVTMANLAFTAANWNNTTSLTSTFAWSADTTLSNPLIFAHSATTVIAQQSGKRANTCVVDLRTHNAIKEHQSIVDRVKHTSKESIGPNVISSLFEVDKYLVASGIRNTGEEGLAHTTTNQAFIWTDAALFAYVERSPGLKKPSAFYTFFRNNDAGNRLSVKKWREDKRDGDMIEVQSKYDINVVASDCAYLVVNTVQ